MQNPLDKEQTIAVGELDAAAHIACSTISCCTIISPELSACFNHASAIKLGWTASAGYSGPCEDLESQKADERDRRYARATVQRIPSRCRSSRMATVKVAAIGIGKLMPPKITKWSRDDMAFEPIDRPKRRIIGTIPQR